MREKVVEPSEILVDLDGTIRDEPIRANPWIRFLARMFDYSLFFLCLYGLQQLAAGRIPTGDTMGYVPYEYFLWIPFEALLLRFWGTTPGKWITGTDLRQGRRGKLDYMAALTRGFKVWIRGIGLGIPFLNAICMAVAYQRLKLFQITSWDRDDHIQVTHRPISEWRYYFAAVVAIGGLLFYFNS